MNTGSAVSNSVDDRMKLIEVASNFPEVNLTHKFSCDEAIQFVNQYKSLKAFEFNIVKTENYNKLMDTFAGE